MKSSFKVEPKQKGDYFIYSINDLDYTIEYSTELEAYTAGLLNLVKVIKSNIK